MAFPTTTIDWRRLRPSKRSACIAATASPSAARGRRGRTGNDHAGDTVASSACCAPSPLRGRLFTEQEAEVGQNRKVVLSYGFWQRLYAGQDAAVGTELRINGMPYTIVGVMPQELPVHRSGGAAVDRSAPSHPKNAPTSAGIAITGSRLGGSSRTRPSSRRRAQIDAINRANLERFPQLKEILINAGFTTHVRPLHADLVESSQKTLYLLWGGVLFVLVIGCVNVANLVSVRASGRVRELATRHALGASMQRLARQVLTETVVLGDCRRRRRVLLGCASPARRHCLGDRSLAARH